MKTQYTCEKCGGAMILDDTTIYPTCPPKYAYKCEKCGAIRYAHWEWHDFEDMPTYRNPSGTENNPSHETSGYANIIFTDEYFDSLGVSQEEFSEAIRQICEQIKRAKKLLAEMKAEKEIRKRRAEDFKFGVLIMALIIGSFVALGVAYWVLCKIFGL